MYYLCSVQSRNDKIDQKMKKTIEISNNLYIFMVQRWKVHNKIFSNLRWIRKYVLPLHQKIKKTI